MDELRIALQRLVDEAERVIDSTEGDQRFPRLEQATLLGREELKKWVNGKYVVKIKYE
jgi:hypothetical protein